MVQRYNPAFLHRIDLQRASRSRGACVCPPIVQNRPGSARNPDVTRTALFAWSIILNFYRFERPSRRSAAASSALPGQTTTKLVSFVFQPRLCWKALKSERRN